MALLSYITDVPATYGPFSAFEGLLRRLRDIGYQAVEFPLTYPYDFDPVALAAVCAHTGLRISAFLTGWSYFHEGLALSSPDLDVRRRAVARLVGHLEVAARFETQLVVGQIQGFRADEPDARIANERIADSLGQVSHDAMAAGVGLVMEPVNHLQVGFNTTVADVSAMVARIGSPCLRPMVDTLHMNIEERSLVEPIHALGARLGHVHLCEANGGIFGTGHMDFAAVLRALDECGYTGYIAVKVYRNATWEVGATSAYEVIRRIQSESEGALAKG